MLYQYMHAVDIKWMIKRRKMFDDFYQRVSNEGKYYLVAKLIEPVNGLEIIFYSSDSDKKIIKEKKEG